MEGKLRRRSRKLVQNDGFTHVRCCSSENDLQLLDCESKVRLWEGKGSNSSLLSLSLFAAGFLVSSCSSLPRRDNVNRARGATIDRSLTICMVDFEVVLPLVVLEAHEVDSDTVSDRRRVEAKVIDVRTPLVTGCDDACCCCSRNTPVESGSGNITCSFCDLDNCARNWLISFSCRAIFHNRRQHR